MACASPCWSAFPHAGAAIARDGAHLVVHGPDAASWARIEAAHRNMSVSRLIGELLHEHMRDRTTYQDAMQRYLARIPTVLKDSGRYPAREDLHDRARLR